MSTIVFWIILIGAIGAAGAILARAYASGASPAEFFFGGKPVPRLSVVEHASVDGKRKLVLIRRDDVEHLLLTGGPVDVVIETGIASPHPRPAADVDGTAGQVRSAPFFSRELPAADSPPPGFAAPDLAAER